MFFSSNLAGTHGNGQLLRVSEKLVGARDDFARRGVNHVTTVERMICFKTGSGGTAGVRYLRKVLDLVLFPELWQVRTDIKFAVVPAKPGILTAFILGAAGGPARNPREAHSSSLAPCGRGLG